MIPKILTEVENHLWQSTLFAALAGLFTLALRGNRARIRHAVWLAASLKFVVPFAMLTWLGSQVEWRKPVALSPPANFAIVMDEVAQPFEAFAAPPALVAPRTMSWPQILFAVWAVGFLGISVSWSIRWQRIRAIVRTGSPIQLAVLPGDFENAPTRTTPFQRAMRRLKPSRSHEWPPHALHPSHLLAISSSTLLEPGVFGVLRPVLLLPEGIVDRLTPAQLQSVIEHELCHVRHRDNLIATIQMFSETVFWFHPLVWWIGKRMVAERERACDEAVLSMGSEPQVYAEAILNVCKLYVESPLVCVAGVTGAGLKQRIQAIVANRPALAFESLEEISAHGHGGRGHRNANRDRHRECAVAASSACIEQRDSQVGGRLDQALRQRRASRAKRRRTRRIQPRNFECELRGSDPTDRGSLRLLREWPRHHVEKRAD
jgi:bla regulator protein blaR1